MLITHGIDHLVNHGWYLVVIDAGSWWRLMIDIVKRFKMIDDDGSHSMMMNSGWTKVPHPHSKNNTKTLWRAKNEQTLAWIGPCFASWKPTYLIYPFKTPRRVIHRSLGYCTENRQPPLTNRHYSILQPPHVIFFNGPFAVENKYPDIIQPSTTPYKWMKIQKKVSEDQNKPKRLHASMESD